MATIYLSSTYEDLKDYRRAVFDALRKARHRIIAMEDYVAADQRPVEQCLKDVEKADIYIGIFAFRYGYVPPPRHNNPNALSITELEYRHAEALGKPRLAFLAKDDGVIPLKHVDAYTGDGGKGERINALRQHLLMELMTSQFSSPHELSMLVLAALATQSNLVKSLGSLAATTGKKEADNVSSGILEDMVIVPKGPFWYGDLKTREVIDYNYWIDKYPVTNKRYRAFILADGYENQQYWSPEGWMWLDKGGIIFPKYWEQISWEPILDDDEILNDENDLPVVGVSYYEAEAFAKFVGKRLPTEKEWEKAARGIDGRKYPWGNKFGVNRCNCKESGFDRATSVTKFDNGVSPNGCHDMVGNVWEWCASWYADDNEFRVVRGGSWINTSDFMLASKRGGFSPDDRRDILGFRLVQDID